MALTTSSHCRLISIRGLGTNYLERIEFVWAPAPGAAGPLVSTVNQWHYLPGDTPVFRVAATGQPQCLSRDGTRCITSRDGYSLCMCFDMFSARPVTCTATDGASDPLHWCNKARGALGEAQPWFEPPILGFPNPKPPILWVTGGKEAKRPAIVKAKHQTSPAYCGGMAEGGTLSVGAPRRQQSVCVWLRTVLQASC